MEKNQKLSKELEIKQAESDNIKVEITDMQGKHRDSVENTKSEIRKEKNSWKEQKDSLVERIQALVVAITDLLSDRAQILQNTPACVQVR